MTRVNELLCRARQRYCDLYSARRHEITALTARSLISPYGSSRNGEKVAVSRPASPFFNYAFAYFTGIPCRIQRRARRQLPDRIYEVNNNLTPTSLLCPADLRIPGVPPREILVVSSTCPNFVNDTGVAPPGEESKGRILKFSLENARF